MSELSLEQIVELEAAGVEERDQIEAELAEDATVELMIAPPAPTKASTRVYWHKRSPSGPFSEDGLGRDEGGA